MRKEYFHRGKSFQDELWLQLTPKTIKYSKPESAGSNTSISIDTTESIMYFLAANEIQDDISHNWEPIENVVSRLQEKYAAARKEMNLSLNTFRIDTNLIYQDSNRHEVTFMVYLATYDDPQNQVLYPVQKLMKYSCPNIVEDNLKIGLPHVFKVKLGSIMKIDNAALIGVQPAYQGPYIQGIPSYCELSLTFKDIEPLDKKSIITVGEG